VIVHRLPKNLIQHVRSSDNLELKAVLDPPVQRKKDIKSTTQPKATTTKLAAKSSKVSHHATRHKHRVQQSRPVSLNDSDNISEISLYFN
jgi:hypothetical protein